MDRINEQAALLALFRDRKRGWGSVADRIEEAGSAVKIWEIEEAAGQGELFDDTAPSPDERLQSARSAIEKWEAEGIRLVTLLDAGYPAQLLTIHQRPPFLFYRGTLDSEDAYGVAVVGTRNVSPAGLRRATEISTGLAERGRAVISGLAAGVDTAAHLGALARGGRTVAVIGTGLNRAYPPENAELQDRLGRSHLVISQFWPDAAPTKTSFPMRNAVMSGYAAATVVVEAAYRSGARMQARLALEHGRPVFLLDTLLAHDWAQDYAQRPGATVVRDVDDVLSRLDEVTATPDRVVW